MLSWSGLRMIARFILSFFKYYYVPIHCCYDHFHPRISCCLCVRELMLPYLWLKLFRVLMVASWSSMDLICGSKLEEKWFWCLLLGLVASGVLLQKRCVTLGYERLACFYTIFDNRFYSHCQILHFEILSQLLDMYKTLRFNLNREKLYEQIRGREHNRLIHLSISL